jgi:hypothetical protein
VSGRVSVVRGGKRLLHARHHLDAAELTEDHWRQRWCSARRFLDADGESGKRYGNETIRVTPGGQASLRLPAPLAHLANAPHGRYVLTGRVVFTHRAAEWAGRAEANQAVAYRIHHDVQRDRWYLDASWQRIPPPAPPLESLRAGELIGVDMNAGHLAAWRLDPAGNPVGAPRTFGYDLSGPASRRDAQVRHALTRLLHWATSNQVHAIAVEDLDSPTPRPANSTAAGSGTSSPACPPPDSGPGCSRWPPAPGSQSSRSTPPTPRNGAPGTGTSRWSHPAPRPPGTTPRAWRSDGAPSGTASGDGRHRPATTRAMVAGIGPSRPHPVPQSATKSATPGQDHAPNARAHPGRRTRTTRRPSTVRGRPPSRTHLRSVSRNGSSVRGEGVPCRT